MQPIGSFSGLASGFQWRDLVDQVMAQERARRVKPIQDRSGDQQARIGAWNAYGELVGKLAGAASSVRTGDAFETIRAAVSESPVTSRTLLAASATSAAAEGRYQVEVMATAEAEKLGSAGQTSASDALELSGTISINGISLEIEVGDSLNDIRDRINAGDASTGVRASVLRVADGDHRLILTSETTGAEGVNLQDDPDTSPLQQLGLLNAEGEKNVLVEGADAHLRIDGVDIVRSDNVFSGVIAGVTLTAEQAEVGTTLDLEVGRDDGAAEEAVRALVDAYNEIAAFVGKNPPDARSFRTSLATLRSAVFSQVGDPAETSYTRAAVAGVAFSRDGTLQIDEATLGEALASDPEGAQGLFAGLSDLIHDASRTISRSGDGVAALRVTGLETSIRSLDRRAEDAESRVEQRRDAMVRQYIAMERALDRIQAQGSWLQSQIQGLDANRPNR